MTGPALPPGDATTRPERLAIVMAVLLVAVGNFAAAIALLVLDLVIRWRRDCRRKD